MSGARATGFSLFELLLAAALGLAMTTAIVQLFVGNSRSQAVLAGQARLQEAGRHALDFIARSARNAGYLGCGTAGQLANGLNGDWRQVVEVDVSTPVEGFDAAGGAWRPSLGALPMRGIGGAPAFRSSGRINASRLQPNSDLVVFRRADIGEPLANAVARETDPIAVAGDVDGFSANAFALLSACGQAALFRVSSVAKHSGGTTLARAPGAGPFGNRSGAALLHGGTSYGGHAEPQAAAVALVVTETYYVAESAANNNRGRTAWSLWRKTSTAAPAELVQGIEELQLLFGIDGTPDDGDRSPNRYVRADAIGARPVRTVHVSVAASSVDAVAADGVTVQTFSRTVALRN